MNGLGDFGVTECPNGVCSVDFGRPKPDPRWEEFDARVARRRELIDQAREAARERAGLPPRAVEPVRVSIFDLVKLKQSEQIHADLILGRIDPDDILGVVDTLCPGEKAAFLAGFAVGRSI
ncbi:MAG TPA: hypothetical protein PLK94_03895 [Alphaproteobacteria bacterium]|nr:hypothetical protein [Alphaproteobacteria bacterium]